MKNSERHIELFEISGCLKQKAIERWVQGTLSREDMKEVEKHISSCDFCRDALEGIKSYSSIDNFKNDIEIIHQNLEKTLFRGKRKVRSIFLPVISVAASVAIVISVFIIVKTDKSAKQIVTAEKEHAEKKTEALETIQSGAIKDSVLPVGPRKPAAEKREMISTVKDNTDSIVYDEYFFADFEADEAEEEIDVIADESIEITVDERYSYTEKEQDKPAELAPKASIVEESTKEQYSVESKSGGFFKGRKKANGQSSEEERIVELADYDAVPYEMYIMSITDKAPVFQGNEINDFGRYILDKLPQSITIPGNSSLEFTVDSSGTIINAGINSDLEKEKEDSVLEIVYDSPAWIPAYSDKKAIDCNMKIIFR